MLNPIKTIKMKKFINFAVCCLWVLGTIGGIGYALYEGAYPIAAGVAALSIMSFPTVKKHFNELTE
jgi:choline-glycine betaine transporter